MPSCSNAAAAGSGSSSMIFTTTETGWHVLKIKKYSQTKGVVGVGNSFNKSDVFTVGGHRWFIDYYPDGYADDVADCISFDLVLDHAADAAEANVRAKYVFSLLDQAGNPVPEYTKSCGVCTFSGEVPSWGFEQFIGREELEASPYLKDDSFSIRCDVTVYKEGRAKITATPTPLGRSFLFFGFVLMLGWVLFMQYCSMYY